MKAAKKRYHKKIPKFWNILNGEQAVKDSMLVGYKGRTIECDPVVYCPYIPIFPLIRQINDD